MKEIIYIKTIKKCPPVDTDGLISKQSFVNYGQAGKAAWVRYRLSISVVISAISGSPPEA